MPNHAFIRRSIRLVLCTVLVAVSISLSVPQSALAVASFRITGGGFGHGIGLSQYGAKGYAEDGWSYADIVRWYYGGDRDGSSSGVSLPTLASLGKYPNPNVKVHLAKDDLPRTSWTLKAWKTRMRISDDAGVVRYLPADTYYKFTLSGDHVTVNGVSYTGTVIARPEATATVSTPLMVVYDGSGGYGTARVRYRGEVRLSPYSGKLRALNVVPIESYVYGVVPRESISSWHMEALKAQAIAARSYAWASAPPSDAASSTLSGILHCTTYSQMYCGHSHIDSDGSISYTLGETTRTNDAVDATAGRIVYHAPTDKIVTTYFSSSSGGHTANIEDVWLSSDPKPYYKGVADRDDVGNPYHSWDPVIKTGTQLASALGQSSRGSVTSVSHDKAASGFVRYVTFRFSNGTTYKVTGGTVRSKLSLKSTKFNIGPVDVWRTYQQTDSKLGYAGSWKTYRNTRLSGGSYKYASRNSALVVFTFRGTGFKWITAKGSANGYGDVYLDGVKASRVNLYSSSVRFRSTVWSKTGLSADTTHTVIIHVTGKHASGSRGNNVGIDAVQVLNGSLRTAVRPSAPNLFDDTDSRITYAGTWTTTSNPLLYNGTYQWSQSSGDASATFSFIGTRVRLVTSRNTTYGLASVYLDSRAPVTVDATGSALVYRQPVWDSGALPFGVHRVRVVPSTNKPFGIDRLDVWAGQLTP